MTLYVSLYSDFPFSLGILTCCFVNLFRKYSTDKKTHRTKTSHKATKRYLFYIVIPVVCTVFFVYNLLPSLLIFRTYSPFFGIGTLYVSYYIAKMIGKGKVQRMVVAVLIVFMVIRGGGLLFVTSSQNRLNTDFQAQINEAVDDSWSKTLIITPYNLSFEGNEKTDIQKMTLEQYNEFSDVDLEISEGELVVTGGFPYALAGEYILPGNTNDKDRMAVWREFTEVNAEYFVGQSYPDWYYYVYGGWIRGGTLSTSLIPCNYIYFRPQTY